MPGQIKAGRGTLIGNAGEYYVVAELLKRGVVAALAPRNAPSFDVLATLGSGTVRIRVKTKSQEYDVWQWGAKADGVIFRDLQEAGDFTVLVDLAEARTELSFHIVPSHVLNGWLITDFSEWLVKPGKNGRPHSPTNKQRHLSLRRFGQRLLQYKENWDLLWE